MNHHFKINEIKEILGSLFDFPAIKFFTGLILSFMSFGFDGIHNKAFLAVFILIIADFVTAVFACYTKGVCIRSSKFVRTPIKLAVYFGLIYIARVSEFTVPILHNFLDETMIAFIATTELVSILENIHKMGYPVPSNLIKKIINIRDSN